MKAGRSDYSSFPYSIEYVGHVRPIYEYLTSSAERVRNTIFIRAVLEWHTQLDSHEGSMLLMNVPGTFGKVKLGRHILTGQHVAIKLLEKHGCKMV